MFKELKNAFISLAALTLITGVAYPLAVTVIAQFAFSDQANGSLLPGNAGSSLIAQPFDDPKYFWPRLSGASWNASASSGTNFAPTNPALVDAAKARIAALHSADPDNKQPIPIDLVTASGSGLDPHISPAAAEYQIARVARARHLAEADVRKVVVEFTTSPTYELLGEPRVNVLLLNLALDGKITAVAHDDSGWLRGRAFLPE